MPENLRQIPSSVLNQKYIWADLQRQTIRPNLELVAMTTHMLCLQLSLICTSKQFCKFISNSCLVYDQILSDTIQGFYQLFFVHRVRISHVITVRVTCSTTKNVLKSNDPIACHVDILRGLSHIPLHDEPKEHLCMRLMIQWFCSSFYLYFVGIKILVL